jgi:arabinose-5-phosphate isomerase
MNLNDQQKICALARKVIETEVNAIIALTHSINEDFVRACECILQCQGRVVVTGLGKSGHIARKIAATLASTGTPAFFMHSGEASHGDLGMITVNDVVLALSNSGETTEILTLLPIIKRLNIPLIAMTSQINSTLATFSHVHLNIAVKKEACPLGLAPTSSTTAALVMGDALAVSLLEIKGFTSEDFAFSHPGGSLGKQLLLSVDDLMTQGKKIPTVTQSTLVTDALAEITAKKLGMTAVVNQKNQVIGIFTDGDVRRMLGKPFNLNKINMKEVMTSPCTVIQSDLLAAEAMQIMEKKEITTLLVVDKTQYLVGVLTIHALIHSGII